MINNYHGLAATFIRAIVGKKCCFQEFCIKLAQGNKNVFFPRPCQTEFCTFEIRYYRPYI